jgi:hypothetical protein
MPEDADDDMSELTEAQRAVVLGVRAARARGAEREARGEPTLAEGKQAWPIGMRKDGTLNVVEE